MRELDFQIGDKIACENVETILEREANKIFNTGLFVLVEVDTSHVGKFTVELDIKVLERWYIWPVPIFEVQSLNINQWLLRFNGNLDRLNYGMRLNWNNFLGRKQHLELNFRTGFLKNYALVYSIPFLEPTQTLGLRFETSYKENNTISYRNTNNFIDFANLEEQALQSYKIEVSVNKRIGVLSGTSVRLLYNFTRIKDTVLSLNKRYLAPPKRRLKNIYLFHIHCFTTTVTFNIILLKAGFSFSAPNKKASFLNDVVYHIL